MQISNGYLDCQVSGKRASTLVLDGSSSVLGNEVLIHKRISVLQEMKYSVKLF